MHRLRVLGAATARSTDGSLLREVVRHPKRLALLTILAVEGADRPVQRETLLGILWPESSPSRARNALSQMLYHLRKALGPDVIVGRTGDALWLDPAQLSSDVGDFHRLVDAGSFAEAFELYEGELLAGVRVAGAGAFDRWLDATRSKLRTRHSEVTDALLTEHLEASDLERAAQVAIRAAAARPNSERLVREVMEILARSGDRVGALAAYDAFANRMETEFESEPAAETRALAASIRAETSEPSEPIRRLPETAQESTSGRPPGRPAPTSTDARLFRTAAAVVALIAVGTLSFLTLGSGSSEDVEVGTSMLVMPFTVRGDVGLTELSESMVTLLSTRLDGVGGAQTINPRSVFAHVDQGEADGAVVGRAFGASHYIVGDVVAAGDAVELSASVFETGSGSPTVTVRTSGDPADVITLVDRLAADILATGFLQPRSRTADLAVRTTDDLEALKSYLQGDRLIREGRYHEAVLQLQDAVAHDSTFALAHYQLAIAANWADDPATAAMAAAQAYLFRETLTPRARALVEALEPYSRQEYWAADTLYRAAVERYPDQLEAWYMLGESIFHGGYSTGTPMESSRPMFERILAEDPHNAEALIHAVRLAARDGDTRRVVELARTLEEEGGGGDRALEARALSAFASGGAVARSDALDELRDGSDLGVALTSIGAAVFLRDLATSREVARLLEDRPRGSYSSWAEIQLVRLALAQGRLGEATALVEQISDPARRAFGATTVTSWIIASGLPSGHGGELVEWVKEMSAGSSNWPPAMLAALVEASVGTPEGTAKQMEELAEIDPLQLQAVRAWHAWQLGDPDATVRALVASRPATYRGAPVFTPAQGDRILYAKALAALGRHDDAIGWLSAFGDHTGYDVMLMAPAEIELARIHAALGNDERARQHYGRVVHFWSDADQHVEPLLLEARQFINGARTDR